MGNSINRARREAWQQHKRESNERRGVQRWDHEARCWVRDGAKS